MILSCNSCGKKFVVPDQAINENGRLVQCGSCGNKWKQFPISSKINIVSSIKKKTVKKKQIDAIVSRPKKKETEKNKRDRPILSRIFGKKTWNNY